MIEITTTKVKYTGDGETNTFPIPYPYADGEDILATIYNTTTGTTRDVTHYRVNSIDKTVTLLSQDNTTAVALAKGEVLVIYRRTQITQEVDLGDKYPLPRLEEMIDKLTRIAQELQEEFSRSVKVSIMELESPEQRYLDMRVWMEEAESHAIETRENANAAATSEKNAASSAESAKKSQDAAATSASRAASSESAAASSASSANAYATAARTSENSAASSASSAGNYARSASTDSSSASTSATKAQKYASQAAESVNICVRGQLQADWLQTDKNRAEYIQHKPTKVSAFENDAGYAVREDLLSEIIRNGALSLTLSTSTGVDIMTDAQEPILATRYL